MDKTNISCKGSGIFQIGDIHLKRNQAQGLSCSGPISYGRIQYQGPYFAIFIISIVLVGKDYTKVIGYMS